MQKKSSGESESFRRTILSRTGFSTNSWVDMLGSDRSDPVCCFRMCRSSQSRRKQKGDAAQFASIEYLHRMPSRRTGGDMTASNEWTTTVAAARQERGKNRQNRDTPVFRVGSCFSVSDMIQFRYEITTLIILSRK